MTGLLACGNCVYDALWQLFPPTRSWIVIFPAWLLVLSAMRTLQHVRLWGVPPLYVTVPLIVAVFFLAPSMIGPPLGFWIPICCIVGTVSGISAAQSAQIRRCILGIAALALLALIGGGTWNYVEYRRMPQVPRTHGSFSESTGERSTRQSGGRVNGSSTAAIPPISPAIMESRAAASRIAAPVGLR